MQTSGEMRREIAKPYPGVIASGAKQSISRHREKNGLLRFARKDVERSGCSSPRGRLQTTPSTGEASDPDATSERPVGAGGRNRPAGLDFRQPDSPLVTKC